MKQENFAKLQRHAEFAANLLKLLSNETRLQILCQLIDGEKPVTEIETNLQLGQSAVSQHLSILRRGGVVKTRREAQRIYYSLSSPEAARMLNTLSELYC